MKKADISKKLEAMLVAESGISGWVHPKDVFARVETWPGADVWQVEAQADAAALHRVYNDLAEKYLKEIGSLSKKVDSQMNEFDKSPSLPALVKVVMAMIADGFKF